MENNEEIKRIEDISNEAEETKVLLELFFKGNYSDKELERLTGIPSTTIGRRITNIENYKEIYKNYEKMYEFVMNKRKLNLIQGKKLGSQIAALNNSENPKVDLSLFFSAENSQLEFLRHLILTFRIKDKLLLELFDFNMDDIKRMYENYENNSVVTHAFGFVFNESDYDQEIVKENVISYLRELLQKRKENKEEYKQMLYDITDKKIMDIKSSHLGNSDYTKEEFEEIFKFHFKYSMNHRSIASFFNISPDSFRHRLETYISNHPELNLEHQKIKEYNIAVGDYKFRMGHANR